MPGAPLISVIVANYNGERFLRRSIASILSQTHRNLEVIVSDDGSTDGSLTVLEELARDDPRVRFLADGTNGGPSRARNRALDAARGEWVAVVDSDDLLHPERFERMLAVATSHSADAVADNLLHFQDDRTAPATLLFSDEQFDRMFQLTAELAVRADTEGSGLPNFGYLKPFIRTARLGGLRYDERLKIGEDYDFMLRLLLKGAKFLIVPEPTYLYRRHSTSTSHRLSVKAVEEQIEGQLRLESELTSAEPALKAELAARMAALQRGLRFEKLVAAIKDKRFVDATGLLARDPALSSMLFNSLRERTARRMMTDRSRSSVQAVRSPLTVVLTDAEGPRETGEGQVEAVPAYLPADQVEPSRALVLRAAIRLVELCRTSKVTLVSEGRAGRYAAGFVPFDHEAVEIPTPAGASG
ncbi:MAG: glycosyltransferase family 2 protein [Rhizobiaceae bacterium]|nr:glycosyltransferase family 2 protein [Rhizobiaceae bacterium]